MRRIFFAILSSVFLIPLLPTPVRAEFPPENLPKDSGLSPKRRRMDTEPRTSPRNAVVRTPIPADPDDSRPEVFRRKLALSLLTGLSSISSSDTATETKMANIGVKDQFLFGAGVDFQFLKNFGIDVDAYSASTPRQEEETSPSVFDVRQIASSGLLVNLRAEWPLPGSGGLWRPRLLLGYAAIGNTFNYTASATASTASVQVTGISLGAGAVYEMNDSLSWYGDFIMSINSSAFFSSSGSVSSSYAVAGSGFMRLRGGVNVRVWNPLWIGGQVSLRTATSSLDADWTVDRYIGETNRLLQFLATATVVF